MRAIISRIGWGLTQNERRAPNQPRKAHREIEAGAESDMEVSTWSKWKFTSFFKIVDFRDMESFLVRGIQASAALYC
jgi:hypothetical protein